MEARYPFAAIDVQVATAAAVVSATITKETFLTIGTAALTAAFTLNLILGSTLTAGDKLYVSWLSDTTARAMTAGTGFKGALVITPGTVSKTQTSTFVYDGSAFHCLGGSLQT